MSMALERAGHKCEDCGSRERLEVHHKEPLEPGEQRWNSDKNRQEKLRVLCRACHEKAHHGVTSRYNERITPKEQLALPLELG